MALLRRTSADVEPTYSDFVARASPRLLHTAELLSGDRREAEDAVQNVLLRMFLRWERIEQSDPFGYARRAVVNELTDRWRRHKGREVLQRSLDDTEGSLDPHTEVVERDAVMRLLAVLTTRERNVVVLRFYEDMSEAQIAFYLNIAPGTGSGLRLQHVGAGGGLGRQAR